MERHPPFAPLTGSIRYHARNDHARRGTVLTKRSHGGGSEAMSMPADKRHLVEGYWDCQYCGKQGIPGRFKSCTGCGHPRDASVTFYTKEIDEAHAIDRAEFERQTAEADKNSRSSSANYTEATAVEPGTTSLFSSEEGDRRERQDDSDWYCDYCDSYNPQSLTECKFCGAARDMTEGKTYRQTRGQVARTYDKHGNLVKERDLSKPKSEPPKSAPPTTQGKGGCLKPLLIGAAIILVLAALIGLVFGPKPRTIEVKGFDWEQTIQVEQFQTVDDSGWELPAGGRLDHTNQEVRDYKQVLDHYETVPYQVSEQVLDHYETYTTTVDNGDGTFEVEEHEEPVYRTEYRTEEREEPVYVSIPIYDTKYYYKIEKWVPERDVTTSGSDHEPYWGEVTLAMATGEHGTGEEREGAHTGTYGVIDTEDNHYTADKDYWDTLEVGDKVKVMVDSSNHISPK